MIQTHLIPLQPPFNYIYHGGIVGKQIATLIAIVDKTNDDYRLEAHSHPIVLYNGQTAEGVLWDQVEVMDCRTVCSEIEKSITLSKFNELLMLSDEHEENFPIDPSSLRSALRAAGIALLLPEDEDHFDLAHHHTVKVFNVRVVCQSAEDEYFAWSTNNSPLYFDVKASSWHELKNQLSLQQFYWYHALEEFNIKIVFEAGSQEDVFDEPIEYDENEVKAIIAELNGGSVE